MPGEQFIAVIEPAGLSFMVDISLSNKPAVKSWLTMEKPKHRAVAKVEPMRLILEHTFTNFTESTLVTWLQLTVM